MEDPTVPADAASQGGVAPSETVVNTPDAPPTYQEPTVPETVPPSPDASNPAAATSNDAVLAMLANMNDALQALSARVNAIPNAPAAPPGPGSQMAVRNVDPPEEAHPDHLNGVYHVLHNLIDRAGLDENSRIVLHNSIPNVNPPEAQAA